MNRRQCNVYPLPSILHEECGGPCAPTGIRNSIEIPHFPARYERTGFGRKNSGSLLICGVPCNHCTIVVLTKRHSIPAGVLWSNAHCALYLNAYPYMSPRLAS